jgi:membrane protease YdiL (CAAX protease family)
VTNASRISRIFAFPLVRLVLIVLLFGALAAPCILAIHPPYRPWQTVAMSWLLAVLLLASILVVERFTVKKGLLALGLAPGLALGDLTRGAALGAVLFSAVILELALGGYYRIADVQATRGFIGAALLLFPGALFEELLFRGVVFRLTEEWTGTWIALAVSALLFGLVHAGNPGATWVSTIAIAVEADVLLAAAYVVARNLWFPIGLHFAWNFFEGPVYGTQVSGHVFGPGALIAHLSGPALITGGPFGPEAGFAAVLTCIVAAAALIVLAVRRAQVVPPNWKMTRAL